MSRPVRPRPARHDGNRPASSPSPQTRHNVETVSTRRNRRLTVVRQQQLRFSPRRSPRRAKAGRRTSWAPRPTPWRSLGRHTPSAALPGSPASSGTLRIQHPTGTANAGRAAPGDSAPGAAHRGGAMTHPLACREFRAENTSGRWARRVRPIPTAGGNTARSLEVTASAQEGPPIDRQRVARDARASRHLDDSSLVRGTRSRRTSFRSESPAPQSSPRSRCCRIRCPSPCLSSAKPTAASLTGLTLPSCPLWPSGSGIVFFRSPIWSSRMTRSRPRNAAAPPVAQGRKTGKNGSTSTPQPARRPFWLA